MKLVKAMLVGALIASFGLLASNVVGWGLAQKGLLASQSDSESP